MMLAITLCESESTPAIVLRLWRRIFLIQKRKVCAIINTNLVTYVASAFADVSFQCILEMLTIASNILCHDINDLT
jgi:hypothetical protein